MDAWKHQGDNGENEPVSAKSHRLPNCNMLFIKDKHPQPPTLAPPGELDQALKV